jgi:amino acid adenylation domain-containing protein
LRATSLHITYLQLNDHSDRLAGLLIEKGVQPDTIVAIMMERSVEMIVGILGILKSGGAYLPIDPDYPQERIGYMLNDSNAKILIISKSETRSPKPETNPNDQKINDQNKKFGIPFVLNFEHLDFDIVSSFDIRTSNLIPSNLAYIIYTSGSTGKPKGVLIRHKGFVNLIYFHRSIFKENQDSRVSQVASPAFDAMGFEVWPCLLSGASLDIADNETRLDPRKIRDWLIRHCITISFQPTVMAEHLLNESWPPDGVGLKSLCAAGDELNCYPVQGYSFKLYNLYGPTEDTVWTTWSLVNTEPNARKFPSIGKPIANHRVYILDSKLNLQLVGLSGELCITGIGLAEGYLNNPELTADKFKFVPNFLTSSLPHFPLYRTGDLARWLPDGNIEYLGRIDHQVKIRGFRIEPGEIEIQLLDFNGIEAAAVVPGVDEKGDKYLCAYIVAPIDISVEKLRGFLSGRMPDYMIPSYLVPVERIPLTHNGKLDIKALPVPKLTVGKDCIRPRNSLEEKLAEIWADVLSLEKEKLSIDANFFQLGGHSLKAITMAAHIHKELKVKLPLTEVFRTPTIQGLSEYIRKLKHDFFISIDPAEEKEYYPQSSSQGRLYVLQQMDLEASVYNIPLAVILEGELGREKLECTFFQLIRRHESLRTSFHIIHGEPVQRIHQNVEFKIDYHDISHISQIEAEAVEKVKAEFFHAFDLSRPPLLRVSLLKEQEQRHLLMLHMHHIITDGVSMDLFINETMALYSGEILPPLKFRYRDYTEWQMSDREKKAIKEQEKYWLEQFADEVPALDMPIDYPRPAVQSSEGTSLSFEVPVINTRALNQLAQQTGTTMYMVLLAVYTIFLSKVTGQEDIVVGSPIAGRRHADLEKIIGMFVNTLALRIYPKEEKTFYRFLLEVKEKTLRAIENQDYHYEDLVDRVAINRDAGRNPLFDTMLALQNTHAKEIEIPGLKLVPYEYVNKISKFDLTLTVLEAEEKLQLTFEYCTKLFREETINRFMDYFKNIVNGLIENKERRIAAVEIITETEKRRILVDFNDTETGYPKNKTIHQLFKAQASKTPDHIALVGACVETLHATSLQHQITYYQLNEKSDRLAGLLIEKGVLPDSIVAIMMERSVEMIIGIMGILKAGGAYLPIEPDYPQERIDYMLKDSGAKLLVTTNDGEGEKVRRWEGEKIFLEEILKVPKSSFVPTVPSAAKIAEGVYLRPKDANSSTLTSTSTSTCQVGGANLAYIIYTSGSTGRPKGVMAEHQGLVNYIWWAAQKYVKNERINFSLYSSISFDLTVTSLFTPLITGNEIVIYEAMDKEFLIEKIIDDNRTAVIKLTPSHLKLIKEKKIPGASSMIKRFIVGGEKFGSSLARDIYDNFDGKIEMYNEYGPTEAVVGCMIHKFDPGSDQKEFVPIGIPINNTRIYILDKYLNPVPIGVPGEISIGGHGLARGYLNRTEFTSEQFIENPFIPGQKIYKSGDFACWLPDGNIQFIGRIDQQVKIRGFRIEIEEIECRLLQHEEIKDATIIAKKSKNGDIDLWAYLVSTRELTTHELKEYLGLTLPGYMIPSYFVSLEKMPITSGGKVDKKMLASIAANMKTGREFVPAQTDLQKKIASIWQEVLGITSVSITDNFFDLGGNSLKLITLNRQLNEALEMNVPVVEMFKYTTIETFLDFIETRNKAGAVPAIDKERITDDLSKVEGLLHGAIGMLGGK